MATLSRNHSFVWKPSHIPKRERAPTRVRMSLQESAPTIAIVDVTGAVGQEFLSVLSDQNAYRLKTEYCVEKLTEESFDGVNIALFSAGGGISKKFEPLAVEKGSIVADNSSAFRMTENVPLVIPEVNPEAMEGIKVGIGRGALVANPNCSTIICLMTATPLHRRAKVSLLKA